MRKGIAFAMQVLIVVVVILVVALIVLSIFGGGIMGVTQRIPLTTETQAECSTVATGARCESGCSPGYRMNLVGQCPPGQICCEPVPA